MAWLVLLSIGCSNQVTHTPLAHDGTLNLQGWNFETNQPINLKGNWEFHWKELLTPTDFAQEYPSHSTYMALPNSWNNYVLDGKQLSGTGYATYRLNIRLDQSMTKQELALKMPYLNFSYKLWIDGKLVTKVGKVGTSRDSSVPKITTELIPFTPKNQSVEIIIQVSNFQHERGGIVNNILLGTANQLITQTSLQTASELFITGSIISIGFYHLMLYWRRKSDKAPLFFGLFCLIWGIRTLFEGEVILTKMFPNFSWEIELKYEYIALYMGTYIFAKYIQSMYPDELPALFCKIAGVVSLLFSIIGFCTPARIFTHTLIYYEIYTVMYLIVMLIIIIKAAFHKREGALLLSVVSVISFLTVVNDFLYYAEKLYIGILSPIGLFIFTLAQMYILSKRFGEAYIKMEQVSYELKETNDKLIDLTKSLEERVEKRTLQLAESNQILQTTNKELINSQESRMKLLSYITHDLKNPISSIIGYTEAVMDNVNPNRTGVYLKYIHDKTIRLHQMLKDLYDLSQLETKNLHFHSKEVEMASYLQQIYDKYELVVTDAGLHFQLEIAENAECIQLMMDPDRIEQVLYNLITNSIKFTKPGGTITMYCKVMVDSKNGSSAVQCKITDTGIGIPEENLPYIFEREFKDYPKDLITYEGSGLGLAICKEIIEFHGGEIWVESIFNQGSSLSFTLPINK